MPTSNTGSRSAARPPSLNERAYDAMRAEILTCILGPGEQLTEAELADRYGLGKASIRNALARLNHEGLVDSSPRRGWAVAPITLQDVHELFELRLILEPQAARLAAGRINERRLRDLEAQVVRGYRPGDPSSQAAFLEANRHFHVAVAEASGNARLAEMINRCIEEVGRFLHLGLGMSDFGDRFQHEHRDLIQALVEGDAAAAESLTYSAIHGGEKIAMEAILRTPVTIDERSERMPSSAALRKR